MSNLSSPGGRIRRGLLSILSYCDVSASIERSRAAIRSFNASMSGASTGALLRP